MYCKKVPFIATLTVLEIKALPNQCKHASALCQGRPQLVACDYLIDIQVRDSQGAHVPAL